MLEAIMQQKASGKIQGVHGRLVGVGVVVVAL